MTHTYELTGMTCGNCEATVKNNLLRVPNVSAVEVSKANNTATVTMEKHVPLSSLQNALEKKFSISTIAHNEATEEVKDWFTTYKPILLIFAYISIIALIVGYTNGFFNWMEAMNTFMAGFFLTFSFFKLLNLKAFAESYSMYDVVAAKVKGWGYAYAFIELALGLAYAVNFDPLITNTVTLIVMSVSIVGVLQSVLNKRKIQCACLGAVFNLPMSTVTIIEDALMIIMSAGMLIATFT